jgi:hypothetical protein
MGREERETMRNEVSYGYTAEKINFYLNNN